MGRGWEENKPVMAMIGLQFSYAVVALSTRSALLQGMSPRVFVVYRQAIATLVLAPIVFFSQRGNQSRSSLGMRSFWLIFAASLIGVTINQNVYFEGLYLASSSIASAMGNLLPAITFVIAAVVGFEKVEIRSLSTMAKILGTIVCVSGAVCMAFARGPKLINSTTSEFSQQNSSLILHYFYSSLATGAAGIGDLQSNNWMIGCLFLFASCCCWSFWLILQVPMSASYPNHLSLSAWMCLFATIQSAILTLFLEPDPNAWRLHSSFELICAIYSGVVGSALSFFVQAWCISLRGPLFSAMFSPLSTVIVTILACLILQEELYTGSLVGAFAVVAGLYVVLWGKAKDLEKIIEIDHITTPSDDSNKVVNILIQDPTEENCKIDLEEPLLAKK